MAMIQRVTTQYDPSEDRFKLLVSLDNEEKVCLWLTQRILSQAIGQMLEWLDSQLLTVSDDQQQQERMQETLQGLAQQKALRSLEKSEAVTFDKHSDESLLITTLNVRKTTKSFTLIFRNEDIDDIILRLTAKQLRQWLLVIHSRWREASWPEKIWPNWITETIKTSANQTRLAVH